MSADGRCFRAWLQGGPGAWVGGGGLPAPAVKPHAVRPLRAATAAATVSAGDGRGVHRGRVAWSPGEAVLSIGRVSRGQVGYYTRQVARGDGVRAAGYY